MESTEPKTKEDLPFDFSEIKQKTKKLFKSIKENHYFKKEKGFDKSEIEKEGNFQFDFNQIKKFTKNNSKWLIPVLLILIAISVSTYLRMMPAYLPITDDWAADSVNNFYLNYIENQINEQYPNLPQQDKDILLEQEFQKFVEENKEQINKETVTLSQQYKAQFQDEKGETYLLEIDPYLWYSEAKNVLKYGKLGDKIIDGQVYFSLRHGRIGKPVEFQLHPYVCVYMYKFLHFFNRDLTLMKVMFLMPVILIGLAIIPTFFIGRKIAGNTGGFFAAIFLAINVPLLGRTPAGFSDTDSYTILLPLLATWLFLEAYATKNKLVRWIFPALAGLVVGIFSTAWKGWSTIFLFILATIIITMTIKILVGVIRNEYTANKQILNTKNYVYNNLIILISFLVSTGFFISLFKGFTIFSSGFVRPIKFMNLKEVGVSNIWPNVLTTVAEFMPAQISTFINQMGGKFIIAIAILGIVLAMVKKNEDNPRDFCYSILLTIWIVSSAYAFTKGMRFGILAAPPLALAIGSAIGITHENLSLIIYKCRSLIKKTINNKKIEKFIKISIKLVVFAAFTVLLIAPFNSAKQVAKNEIPLMNDAWYNSLIKIKQDSTDSIIMSWWDFGHWFAAIAERRVIFDGGDQSHRIYWVGKSLLTDNEAETVGILRMLNCVGQKSFSKLTLFTNDGLKSMQIFDKVLLSSNRDEAKNIYLGFGLTKEQAETMIDYTHCKDLLPNFFITSEDMVSKAGVWGHFGSWDFKKATMYQNTINLNRIEAISYLNKTFNLSKEEAEKIYDQIKNTPADQWIAPWPGYLSGIQECEGITETKLRCSNSIRGIDGTLMLEIDLKSYDVTIVNNPSIKPNSIVYATKEKIEQKKFAGNTVGFSIILMPEGDDYKTLIADPSTAASTFTKLFFLEGHGMNCFSKFYDVREPTGGRIITWKIDYNCQQENKVFFTS